MPTALITGANRGLGLEFVRQYDAEGWRIHATCRDPESAPELKALAEASEGRVSVYALDVADHAQIEALAAQLQDEAIDVLLNNAGVFGDRAGFGQVDYDVWAQTFRINTMGPQKMAESFCEQVARSERKVIANVTSKMGSIADNTSGGAYVYRSSKAALNIVTASQANDLRGRRIAAIVLHPGWVATRMGGAGAPLQAPESVEGMRKVIAQAGLGDSGKFFNYDGAEIPW